jgi:membrane protein required for colicin V production
MTGFDYFALGVVAISIAVGAFRGALREVLSVLGWVAAIFLAWRFSHAIAEFLPSSWSSPTLRTALAFVGVLVGCLMLFGLAALALGTLVRKGGMTGTDRVLGALFGFMRGVVILVALVLFAGLTPLPRERAWRNAVLRQPLESAAILIRTYLPGPLASRIRYE